MGGSKSNSSKSSHSPSRKGSRSRSNSSSAKKSNERERSRSLQKHVRKRSYSNERRSPGRGSRRNPDLIPKSNKLFVTNIDSSFNYEQVKGALEQDFGKFGKIKDINLKTKRGSANSFAFIEFTSSQQAQAGLNGMKGAMFKGKQLKVEFGKGQRKQEDRRADKCYICHKQGHFAKDCRYRQPSRERSNGRGRDRDRRDSRDHHRRRRHSRSDSSSRSYHKRHRRNSYDRDYKRRDRQDRSRDKYRDRERGYRSPQRRRDHRDRQRRQRY